MTRGLLHPGAGDPTLRLGYVSDEAARRDYGWEP